MRFTPRTAGKGRLIISTCCHALHGRGYAPACRRSGEQAASHDGQRVFRKGVYLDRRGIAHRKQGRGCRFPAPRPCSFFALCVEQLERHVFAGLSIKYRLCLFRALKAAEIQAFSAPNVPLVTPLFFRFVFLLFRVHNALNHARYNGV